MLIHRDKYFEDEILEAVNIFSVKKTLISLIRLKPIMTKIGFNLVTKYSYALMFIPIECPLLLV